MALNALKKLTIRDIIKGKPEMVEVEVPNAAGGADKKMVAVTADLVAIYGRAVNHRTGVTALGDFIEYIGSFEARRVKDGEVFQSARAIFPPIASDMVDAAYFSAKKQDEGATVDVGFVIGVEPDPMGVTGYKFTCKPIQMGTAAQDPLAEVRQNMANQLSAVLGVETVTRLGLPAPHDPETGEVAEAEAPAAAKGKGAKVPETA